VSSNWDEVVTR